MSQWTHVNASIGYEELFGMPTLPNFTEGIPEGLDGPLNVFVNQNQCTNSDGSFVVSIYGELRDYKDEQEILKYFQSLIDKHMSTSDEDYSSINGILKISSSGRKNKFYTINRNMEDDNTIYKWEELTYVTV